MTSHAGLKIGSVFLGRFDMTALLGQGGMGRVYKARDTQLARDVAIKVLRKHLAQDPIYLERFKREGRAVARFNHPNIATVYDFGETEQHELYMIQEFLDGVSLRDILDEGRRLPLFKALHFASQAAEALVAAHDEGVIHRDIKPENIIVVNKHSRVVVVDFGIAAPRDITLDRRLQLVQDISDELTSESELVGTPTYMSPEQVRGLGVDHRSDLYALGIVLYRMLAGTFPYSVDDRDLTAVFAAHAFKEPEPLTLEDHKVPSEVWAILQRLLAKEPAQRYQSAEDVSDDLRGAMRESLPPGDPVAQAIVKAVGKARARKRFEVGVANESEDVAPRETMPMSPATPAPSPVYQASGETKPAGVAARTTIPMPTATRGPSPSYSRQDPLPSLPAMVPSSAPPSARADALSPSSAERALPPASPPRAPAAAVREGPPAPFAPAPSWREQTTEPLRGGQPANHQPAVAMLERELARAASPRSERGVTSSSPAVVARLGRSAAKKKTSRPIAAAVAAGLILGFGMVGVFAMAGLFEMVRQVTAAPPPPMPSVAAAASAAPTAPPSATAVATSAPSATATAQAAPAASAAASAPPKVPVASAAARPSAPPPQRAPAQSATARDQPRKPSYPTPDSAPPEPFMRKKPEPPSPPAPAPTAPHRLFGSD